MDRRETPPTRERNRNEIRRRLVSWPLLLSLLSLLAATTVSAWGRGARLAQGDPGEIKRHIEHRVDHLLDRIDADAEQKQAIRTIVAETIEELQVLHEGSDSRRAELRSLLTAETIDRDALEAFRASQVAQADALSRVVAERLADAMEILTPEQRLAVESRLGRHAGRWGHRSGFWGDTRD
jgi:Spy/CpxP family protein refolding chaperone